MMIISEDNLLNFKLYAAEKKKKNHSRANVRKAVNG